MKKTLGFINLMVFAVIIMSCGGPSADANKIVKQKKAYLNLLVSATEDNSIDENESGAILSNYENVCLLKKDIITNYYNDEDNLSLINDIIDDCDVECEDMFSENLDQFKSAEGFYALEARKILTLQDVYAQMQLDAAEDDSLSNQEVEILVAYFMDLIDESKQSQSIYMNDPEAMEKIGEEIANLEEEAMSKYEGIEEKITSCKGFDKLQEELFKKLFGGMQMQDPMQGMEDDSNAEAPEAAVETEVAE